MNRANASFGILVGILASAAACGSLEGLGEPPDVTPEDGGSGDASTADANGLRDGASPDTSSADTSTAADATSPRVTLTASASTLAISQGGSATLTISATAQGISGPVNVVVKGLPSGITAAPILVTANGPSSTLTFDAAPNADAFHGPIAITGALGKVASPNLTLTLDVAGASGALDGSFGTAGIVTIQVGSELTAFGPGWEFPTPRLASIAVQPDGKIVYAGHGHKDSPTITDTWPMILGRLDANGAPDTTFNPSGTPPGMIIQVPLNDSNFVPSGQGSVQILPSGDIAVGGYLSVPGVAPTLFIAEFTTTGELQTNFGTQGLVALGDSSHISDYPGGLVVQPDGKLVLAGERDSAGAALVRVLPNGQADATFAPAPAGSPNVGFDTFTAYPNTNASAAVWLPNGDILTALVNDGTATNVPLAIAVSGSNGVIDTAFGAAGSKGTLVASSFIAPARGIAVMNDKGALLVGSTDSSIELARFTSKGVPDPSFGSTGVASPAIPGGKASAGSIAIGLHGEIVVGATLPGAASIGVVRYTDKGDLDTSFAKTGFAGFAPLPNSLPGGTTQIAIDAYGRIVVGTLIAASGASDRGNPVIMLARYWP